MRDICYYCKKKSSATGKLKQKELEKLGNNCNQVSFQKNDKIMTQDMMSKSILFIKEGLVKLHARGPEKEQILDIIKGPSYIGIPTSVGAKTNQYSATAISETTVCFIIFDVFKEFVIENGEFAYEIISELSKNQLRSYRKCTNQVQKHSAGKIAEAILYFSENIFNKEKFILPLSRNEFGDLTCCTRETVSRILSDLSNNKIIKVNKNNITILDKKKLEVISRMG